MPAFLAKQVTLRSTDGLGQNAVFPILMLLARLQPVSQNADNAGELNVAKTYHEPVLACLNHPNNKVRSMAARAMSVIYSRSANNLTESSSNFLLCRFEHTLSYGQKSNTDWNQVHGTLLAILELVRSRPKEEEVVNNVLLYRIGRIASWDEGQCTCPPSCGVTALEILCLAADKQNHLASNEAERAAKITLSTIAKVSNQCTRVCIGLPQLASEASRVLLKSIKYCIFISRPCVVDVALEQVQRLSHMLNHTVIDIRQASVKNFKKNLNEEVLDFVSQIDVSASQGLLKGEIRVRLGVCSLNFEFMPTSSLTLHNNLIYNTDPARNLEGDLGVLGQRNAALSVERYTGASPAYSQTTISMPD